MNADIASQYLFDRRGELPNAKRVCAPRAARRETACAALAGAAEESQAGDDTNSPAGGTPMQTNRERILTTHTGSLPRPPELRALLVKKDQGEAHDKAELARL